MLGTGDAKTKSSPCPGGAPTELQLASDRQSPVFCSRQHSTGLGLGGAPEESGGGEQQPDGRSGGGEGGGAEARGQGVSRHLLPLDSCVYVCVCRVVMYLSVCVS